MMKLTKKLHIITLTLAAVAAMLLPIFLPFNLIKGAARLGAVGED